MRFESSRTTRGWGANNPPVTMRLNSGDRVIRPLDLLGRGCLRRGGGGRLGVLLVFLHLGVVVLVLLSAAAGVEAAGAWAARADPTIRERPAKAEAMVFMVFFILLSEAVRSVFHYERRSPPLRRDECTIKVSKDYSVARLPAS